MYVRVIAEDKKLGYSSPSDLQDRLEAILSLHAQRTITKLRAYPPPPGSTYRRTGRLRDEWRSYRSLAGGSVSYVLQNDARDPKRGRLYASFVQGRKQTAVMTRIGWKTADELLDREEIAKQIQDEINRYLGGR